MKSIIICLVGLLFIFVGCSTCNTSHIDECRYVQSQSGNTYKLTAKTADDVDMTVDQYNYLLGEFEYIVSV
jgi:uncharacterized protein YxeA